MPTAPTPIKSTSRQKNATSGSNTPGGNRDKYKKLNDLIVSQVGGMGLSMMSVPFFRKDGVVLFAHTQKLSDSMVDCARVNDTMYKTLVTIFSGAVWTVLVLEVASISAAIMSNHNVQLPLPAGIKNALSAPDTSGYSFNDALKDSVKLATLLNMQQQATPEVSASMITAMLSGQMPIEAA